MPIPIYGTEQECELRCLNVLLKTGLLRDKNTALKITEERGKNIEGDIVSVSVTGDHISFGDNSYNFETR